MIIMEDLEETLWPMVDRNEIGKLLGEESG